MRLRFLAPAVVLLAACERADDNPIAVEPPEVWMSTEVESVQRDPATGVASVQLRVRNDVPYTVYLPACGDGPQVALERRSGTAWESARAPICPANQMMAPIALEARGERRFTVTVDEAGEYRAVMAIRHRIEQSSVQNITSNGFAVR